MSSRIEQIIEEIEEFIDSCKFQPLSSTKIVVNKEELEELLRELRMKTPDEIKRYQKIISNKDAILEDAQTKADNIIAEAQAQAQKIVSESEVMQVALQQSNQLIEQTNAQAQEIMDKATEDSNNIRMSAIRYTDEMLENLEKIMSHTIDAAGSKYNNFINSIQSCYDIVSKNRDELSPQAAPSSYTTMPSSEEEAEE
ncbi:MAG: ATPase [Lachnospiraceae bacterium]|nr:ATPase [Lachnospiraceae bacterium]